MHPELTYVRVRQGDDVFYVSKGALESAVRGEHDVLGEVKGADLVGLTYSGPFDELPVQQGVVDEQGFQCAFCMPGFVMAATGFLKTNPTPTRQELAHGVSGNLCRCQDYDKILTALMKGAEYLRG